MPKPKDGAALKALVRGFSTRTSTTTPGTRPTGPRRQVKLPRAQVISRIKATQRAVQSIARAEGISEDAAAKQLRATASEIKSARARLGGILSGLEAKGKTQPITKSSVVRRLTSNRPRTGLKPISREVAELVAEQQTKVKRSRISVRKTPNISRGLLGLRR